MECQRHKAREVGGQVQSEIDRYVRHKPPLLLLLL